MKQTKPNIAQHKRRSARKALGISMLGGCCAMCGSSSDLEFDHIDPSTKIFSLMGKKWSVAKEVWLEELAKCQLLCNSCHKEKTYGPLRKKRRHGTYTMYKRGKCRCEKCVVAHRKKIREYQKKSRMGRSSNG